MDSKLYKLMNWPEIESIVYSECDHPHEILGAHPVKNGTLIQAFFPGSKKVFLVNNDLHFSYEMECVDESGFFAYFFQERKVPEYEYLVYYDEYLELTFSECYKILPRLDDASLDKFLSGNLNELYEFFGAKHTTIDKTVGTSFMVYAPNAERVSVVGEFNRWDGRMHPMTRVHECGIFSIFLPMVEPLDLYKFEIKLHNQLTFLKRDPFAYSLEKGDGDCAVVKKRQPFCWTDTKFFSTYKDYKMPNSNFSLGQLSFAKYYQSSDSIGECVKKIVDYAKTYRFSAIWIEDVSRVSNRTVYSDGSLSLYATDSNKYSQFTIQALVNGLHEEGISVFFTMDLSRFSADDQGFRGFDGTKLYECEDDREVMGDLTYDFSNPFVRNYLLSAALYTVKAYHADGLILKNTDRILYLDFCRPNNDFTPNIYGGNENIKGSEFLKQLNYVLHRRFSNIVTIAADSHFSCELTKTLQEDGYGFDYKLNHALCGDLLSFMENEPSQRKLHYPTLTNTELNSYCENYISYVPMHVGFENFSKFTDKLPGDENDKLTNLRLLLSLLYFHTGKKAVPFSEITDPDLKQFTISLQDLYNDDPVLSSLDSELNGFKWLDATNSEHALISFMRIGKDSSYICVANCSNEETSVLLSVEEGEYKEIFNSNHIKFGGTIRLSGRPKKTVQSKKKTDDFCLKVNASPLTFQVFKKVSCQSNNS